MIPIIYKVCLTFEALGLLILLGHGEFANSQHFPNVRNKLFSTKKWENKWRKTCQRMSWKTGSFSKKTALLLDKQSVTAKTYCKVSKWFSNHQVHAVEHSWTNERHCSLESLLQKETYKQWASKMQFRACKHSRSRLFSRELRKITQVPGMVHFTSHLNTSSLASKHLSV